jgi:hypothetical protein
LISADGAIDIDSTHQTLDQVVATMAATITKKLAPL